MNRVWVTRDEKEGGPLCSALRASRLNPVLEPVLERVVTADVSSELKLLGADDWLVLTSVFAIENVPLELARIPRVAVVGQASEAAALARGFRIELVSHEGTGASLFSALEESAAGYRVVYPRSTIAKVPTSYRSWRSFTAPILYETTKRQFELEIMNQIDVITLTSASAARALDAQCALHTIERPLASIGVTTTKAIIEECKGIVWVQPRQAGFAELAQEIYEKLGLSAE